MDNQRQQQQYIPGPPPPPPQPQQQNNISHIPPPPPRLYGQPQSALPPPPPGPYPSALPPGTVYGLPGGWQQSWGRPGINQGLPPPPPMNQAYGYGVLPQRQPGQLNILPPPPQPQYDKPVLSATFIPGGDSFGPGVGIPPFEDYSGTYSAYAQLDNFYSNQGSNQSSENVVRENRSTSASSARGPLALLLRDSSPVSPGPPTATLRNPQPPTSHPDGHPVTVSQRQRAQSAATSSTSGDIAAQWPISRVTEWLAMNRFSTDWQETFRALNIQGTEFLQLGQLGRGFSSRMYQVVYPKLAQVCSSSSTGWDQAREREEGKRLRRLVARLADGDAPSSAGSGHRRRESNIGPNSAESNQENSPRMGNVLNVDGANTLGPDDSPGKGEAISNHNNLGPPRRSQSRNSIAPSRTKTVNLSSTPNDARHPDSFGSRPDHRGVLNGLTNRGRHSPSLSGDGALGLGIRPAESSPNETGNVQAQTAPISLPSRGEHSKSASVDSSRSAAGRMVSVTNGGGEPGAATRFYEGRRNAEEHARPSFSENQRTSSNDGAVKEHRQGFFSKLRLGNKKHDAHDDQALESPISPISSRTMSSQAPTQMSIPSPAININDVKQSSIHRSQRKFIFATPDGWNYRLIDITEVESAIALRSLICIELSMPNAAAQLFITDPGETEHDEPLDDKMLLTARSHADSLGSLRLYVQRHPDSNITQQHSIGLSLSSKPSINLYPQSEPMVKSNSVGGITRQPSSRAPEFATPEALQKAADQWRRETEKKQRAYLESRKDALPNAAAIRAPRIIDFDSPRLSPYEDKKMENLVPMRKPPAAPSESSTLTKVNSLRKPGEKINRSSLDGLKRFSDPLLEESDRGRKRASGGVTAAGGIGAALANAGRLAGAPAIAGSSQQYSPMSADKGKGQKTFLQHRQRQQSPDSPDNGLFARPLMPRVKSYGPDFEFKETNITFAPSEVSQVYDDSDDDSDDGLFAIPLTNKSANKSLLEDQTNKERPSLTVDTKPKDRRSVAFKSPKSSTGPSAATPGEGNVGSSDIPIIRRYSDDSPGFTGSAISPCERRGRPDSFVSDIWANRPAVENVVDRLDQFFPGVDLDQPYLEQEIESASPAAALQRQPSNAGPSTLRERMAVSQESMDIDFAEDRSESDTLGSDESTLKESNRNKVVSVAARQLSKSGGLGRMKSIREVAKKRNNEITRGPSTVVRTQTQKDIHLQRRKSTKMFGANIVQIKGASGNRLSTLDPIPQEEIPTEDTPKQQATFKIIRGQLIGKGTYGRVYLGMNATTGEFLAVKQVEINQKAAGQDRDRIKEMVKALDLEIDTMQHLEHPNIVQYLGCERKEYSISIYLEYIPGGSVGSCLRKHGKFEEPVVKSLTQQTLSGLAYLHRESILHRDLKADNILLDLDGTCKISDFGISKKSDNIYGNDATNSMQGSVFWMAPEVVRAQGQGYSAKVDIWSLGCVVLEMFAGKRPWSRDEAIGAIFKLGKLNLAPPIPEDVQNEASMEGLNFMFDCFQLNPADRPTADTLLRLSSFCMPDRYYNFYDTNLAAKLRTSEIAPGGI